MSADPSGPAELGQALDALLASLTTDIALIGTELARQGRPDAAAITRALARITQLSHRFVQFLPTIAQHRKARIDSDGPLSPQQEHAWGQLNTRLYTARTWVGDWPRIEALVRAQIPPKRRRLYVTPGPVAAAQHLATDRLLDTLRGVLNTADQAEDARDKGCFADIAFPHTGFTAHVHAAHRVALAQSLRHPPRFLDVGCGGGLKLLAARVWFQTADGLEYDPGYAEAARGLIDRSGTGGCRVIEADGLSWTGYDGYDVIYFYRPMRDNDLLRALETQILAHARPGALIIAPYKMFAYRFAELGCAALADGLYVKGLAPRAATALRRRAELIGPVPSVAPPRAPSIWDPILEASRRNGHGI